MQEPEQNIFEFFKQTLIRIRPDIKSEQITPNTWLTSTLCVSTLDKLKLVVEFEKKYNLVVEGLSFIHHDMTADSFCSTLLQHTKNNYEKKLSKKIFDIINKEYLILKLGIGDAKYKSLWAYDLGLTSIDAMDFVAWAEKRFNVKINYYYFLSIEDVCLFLSKAIEEKNKAPKSTTLFKKIKNKFKTLTTKNNQNTK